MTDTKQTKLSTVDEFLEETGFGKKLMPGDVVIGTPDRCDPYPTPFL